jgi:hypothetical protein
MVAPGQQWPQNRLNPLMQAPSGLTMVGNKEEERMMSDLKGLTAALCLGALIAATPATAADDFYQGKRLTVLINFAVGGPTDIEGRLFAKHIGKHLAGTPTIIVQNMDGGGGATGTNFLGEVAPKDGTVIGYLTGVAWRYVNIKERSRVDFLSYNMIAYQPGTTVYYVRSNVEPGIKVAGDILKAQNLVVGGLTADSSKDILERLCLDLLDVKYKYVTGYTSNSTGDNVARHHRTHTFGCTCEDQIAGFQVVKQRQIGNDFTHIPNQLVHIRRLFGCTVDFKRDGTTVNDVALHGHDL